LREADPSEQGTGGASRRGFLSLGAAGALAAALSACGSSSDPQTAKPGASRAYAPKGGSDADIVNFILKLEYIESAFYSQVVEAGIFSGKTGDLFKLIESNERQHVAKLEEIGRGLGGFDSGKPTTDFAELTESPGAVLRLAATLENLGAAAYLGQIDRLLNRDIMALALSIHTIEARQAAQLNRLIDEPFRPHGPLASPVDRQEVNSAIARFLL
jgi:rubrerythrin